MSILKEGRWCFCGFCDFPTSLAPSHQAAQEMILFAFNIPLMNRVSAVLFSAQSRGKRKMHIWLVNHNQALMLHFLFIGWLPSMFYTFSVWIMWHPDRNLQWPLNDHLGGPSNPLKCNVCYLMCIVCGPQRGEEHSFLCFYLFIFPL